MHINFKTFIAVPVLSLLLLGCTPTVAPIDEIAIKEDIIQLLKVQDKAWNAGDIDKFMDDYWKSDDLRFASAGNVSRGWQATLDGYKERYPDKSAMGTLSFADLEIKVLSAEYAQVFGRWRLDRENDTPGGLFTLLMQNRDGKWMIVSDHTSSNAP